MTTNRGPRGVAQETAERPGRNLQARSEPTGRVESNGTPRFYSVAEAARIIGAAPVTLYRAIRAGEFPAVRIRGRLIVPARALDAMASAAIAENAMIDAADWAADSAVPR